LDEPTLGLDPESTQTVLRLIREMTRDGTTVVLCTHLPAEAKGLADQIVVLDGGANILQGSQAELVSEYFPRATVRFEADDPAGLDALRHVELVRSYQRNDVAIVEVDDPASIPELVALLTSRGVRLTRVEPHVPSLEELYFRVRSDHKSLTKHHEV